MIRRPRGATARERLLAPSLLLLLLLLAPCVTAVDTPDTGPPLVAEVVDGDSLAVTLGGRRESVRLIGIDAPELSHPRRPVEFGAAEAMRFVRDRIGGRPVRLASDSKTGDRDDYGRLLRYVYLEDGTLLNELLIRSGHAFALVRYPFEMQQRFVEAEEQARRARLGLWQDDGLAELTWILERGRRPFRIWPTSNRDWAVAYAGRVRLHVRTAELIPLLTRLVGWSRRAGDAGLEDTLVADGFVPLPRTRDGD